MKWTGIFANKEEIVELKNLLNKVKNTPVIALSVQQGISGNGFANQARQSMLKRCHAIALSHGLPKIRGYYGCNLETGEFVSE